MNPRTRLFQNRPPPIDTTFQATRKRRTKLESKFNRLFPEIKWEAKVLSVRFMIPFETTRELIDDKPKLLKIIFDKIEADNMTV